MYLKHFKYNLLSNKQYPHEFFYGKFGEKLD